MGDKTVCVGGERVNTDQPPYTYLYLNKEFKSKSKWWWSVCVARAKQLHNTTYLPNILM